MKTDVHVSNLTSSHHLWVGVWRLCDPKISLASISSMFLGLCLAASTTPINWYWFALTVFGILSLEAAKNASGEVYDFNSGADLYVEEKDLSPFSGGKKVIVDGYMSKSETIVVSLIFYFLGISSGLLIAIKTEPKVLTIGVIGVLLAFFYHAPPFKLSYRGFGEFAVAIVYGPLICCGTYLVQCHQISIEVVLMSIPLGILIAAFLVINEFPDREADLKAFKKNLVVRLGWRKSIWMYMTMSLIAYAGILCLPALGFSAMVWLGLLGAPYAIMATKRLHVSQRTCEVIPAQRWTLFSFCLAALGSGIGLLI